MRLVVARHGATQHNLDARFTGQFDAPLSTLGELQADVLAQRLASQRFDAIISSDLRRARDTAERIASGAGLPVTLDPALREISIGEWEGRSVSDVRREHGELLDRIETDPLGETAYPQGESWAQFSARVVGALMRWRARYPSGTLLWVAHGGVISALFLNALGLSMERRRQIARGNTCLFEFDYRPTHVVLVRANDTCHLDRLMSDGEGEQSQAL
ncbi:MAG TPA: histidine phosphatase family protein [Ktedonobacterales bacterium]|nr:histidine phosphatase family protein [Ktedonobacterales bacterium]